MLFDILIPEPRNCSANLYNFFFSRISARCVKEYTKNHPNQEFPFSVEEYVRIKVARRSLNKVNLECIRDSTGTKRNGKYYLHIPLDGSQVKTKANTMESRSVVAIDPGDRNFVSTYSPDGTSYIIAGKKRLQKIYKGVQDIDKRLEHEKKEATRLKNKEKFKAKMKVLRLARAKRNAHERISNLVKEMHWKVARRLCEENHTILLPKFETSKMAKKQAEDGRRRVIPKSVVNSMLSQSHYTFREKRLLMKAQQFSTKVIIVGERYTTKTCTNCGTLRNVGGSKVYICRSCGFRGHRDCSASRNIFILNEEVLPE